MTCNYFTVELTLICNFTPKLRLNTDKIRQFFFIKRPTLWFETRIKKCRSIVKCVALLGSMSDGMRLLDQN